MAELRMWRRVWRERERERAERVKRRENRVHGESGERERKVKRK